MQTIPKCPRKDGFTLVELLVVIAIIGVLVSLLLPAVQAAREAARRAQCTSNIKNDALAVLNYENTYGVLPAAYLGHVEWKWPGTSVTAPNYKNWVITILPYLEQQALYDSFVFKDPVTGDFVEISDDRNRAARSTELEVMKCPSDSGNQIKHSSPIWSDEWARGNYGINMIQSPLLWTDTDWHDKSGQGPVRGVSFVNEALKLGQITDGTTNTVMLAEMRSGVDEVDPRGTWALSQCASSAHCNYAVNYTNGPNDCGGENEMMSSAGLVIAQVGEAKLRSECMMPWPGSQWSYSSVVRSLHPGGVNVAMADGSAHFISDFIDNGSFRECDSFQGTFAECYRDANQFRTWQRINISNDEYPLGTSF